MSGHIGQVRPCDWCGEDVKLFPSQHPKRFCSVRCRSEWYVDRLYPNGPNIRLCRGCDNIKLLQEFSRDENTYDGLSHSCKQCKRTHARNRPNAVENRRDYKLRKNYGITLASFVLMLTAQASGCAICSRIPTNVDSRTVGKSLVVDHNHKTGQVRGLICSQCNVALGMVQENISTLAKMVDYLNRYNVDHRDYSSYDDHCCEGEFFLFADEETVYDI